MSSGSQKYVMSKIRDEISDCMIRDRFGLLKSLSGRKISDNEKLPQNLRARIQRSRKLVERRRSVVPELSYPPELPVSQRLNEITQLIEEHQVVVLTGETGSGKTTQLPKICLQIGRGIHGLIAHTQPRRVAARTVASRIAQELGVETGEQVGYQVRFDDHSTPETLVKVMTDGVLLAEIQNDRFLEAYDTIIIDEAHERSLNIDFLLGYLKRILRKRPDLKVIVTSATIDVERFSTHFDGAPIIEVSGRTWPVEVIYMSSEEDGEADEILQSNVIRALQEIERREGAKSGGDVLIFLPGEREIRDMSRILRRTKTRFAEVLPLYSRLSNKEQNRIFASHTQRRIVLATNVAETSLTVPGINYVIDSGVARISRFSSGSRVQQLPIEKISQASADQRKGRCGRLGPGICIRLYSETDFTNRPLFTDPEILRTNLGAVVLQMLVLGLGEIERFPFVEKPPARQINSAYQLLKELEATDKKRKVTKTGRALARMPLDLRLGKIILQAAQTYALKEALIIASALAVQDPRERPHDHQQAADLAQEMYRDEQSDFLAYVTLWNDFEEQRLALSGSQFKTWCRKHFLSYMRMREWREVHRQLALLAKEMKLKMNSKPADYSAVHKAILSGFISHIGQKNERKEYRGTHNRKYFVFPGSGLHGRTPQWIVSAELVETSRVYARTVAEIESEWIEGLAGHLVKRFYDEPHFSASRGEVMAYERVQLFGLTVVERRPVSFGALDSRLSRDIFIRSGLVEGGLRSNEKFYVHNRRLVEEIDEMESRTRRRDILVDQDTIFRFYDACLPEDICGLFDLKTWLKSASSKEVKRLYMNREALMNPDVLPATEQYPEVVEIQKARLKLDYLFDPVSEKDGATLSVPIHILRQVPVNQLDWIIPGLLKEKCLALVKTLPKGLRKNFIPAPQVIDQIVPRLVYDGRSLKEELGDALFRLKGVRVNREDWNEDRLEKYLKINIRVLGEKGEVLAEDRNLERLIIRFRLEPRSAQSPLSRHPIEKQNLTDWEIDHLPENIPITRAGIQVQGFPALVDKQKNVAIEVLDTRDAALEASRAGCLRLFLLALPMQRKLIEKEVLEIERACLLYAARGNAADLKKAIIETVFRYTFIDGYEVIRTRQAFEKRLQNRQDLMENAIRLARLLLQIFEAAQEIELKIPSLTGSHAHLVEDIDQQLKGLLRGDFLSGVSEDWLRQYPRYLKAILLRLEKAQGQLNADREKTVELNRWYSDFRPYIQGDLGNLTEEERRELRWLLEEYRVSLFAQKLGTRMPVSARRLEKKLGQIR